MQTVDPVLIQWFQGLPKQAKQQFMADVVSMIEHRKPLEPVFYRNQVSRKYYHPHSPEEEEFVHSTTYRYLLLKGGEGAGKSVAGIVKTLNNLQLGKSGIMVSPDLPHFKKSLWPEFRLWCPRHWVVDRQRYRMNKEWEPHGSFELVFQNGASLLCGGIENPGSWEGPNRNFAHLDEGRHADAEALKVLDGRCRIGNNPQLYITTTPKKNWLFEYFGPEQDNDKFLNFKRNSLVVTLPVELNRANLAEGYIENRRNSLTESEARVRMDAEWEDESDTEKFVNIFWWDACREQLPELTRSEPAVLALDAPKGSENPSMLADSFAAVLVTRHPDRKQDIAVRYAGIWQPDKGQLLDYEPIEQEIYKLCERYSIVEVCYDPYQLADMGNRMRRRSINAKEFSQQKPRLLADKQLQGLITSRRVAHDGNPLLRQHIDNSDITSHGDEGIRIVKRAQSLKVDAAVALSMAAARSLFYNF